MMASRTRLSTRSNDASVPGAVPITAAGGQGGQAESRKSPQGCGSGQAARRDREVMVFQARFFKANGL